MTQHCKVTFGNISKDHVEERVFESKNQAFVWLNHQLVRQAGFESVHELYFRIESYVSVPVSKLEDFLPF